MAQGYAQTDPRAAAEWIDQFRSEPGYGNAAGVIAQRLAALDAPAAAQLLNTLSDEPTRRTDERNAANQVASRWAADDPLAAAEWARRLAADDMRSNALGGVAQTWAANDFDAARDWALRLPSGSGRDNALMALLVAGARSEPIDTALLNGLSSDQVREQAVSRALMMVAQRDPAEAQALIARHISDPARRRQLEQTVEQARLNSGAAISCFRRSSDAAPSRARLHFRQRDQIRHAIVFAALRQQRRHLAAMMRLMIEEVRDTHPHVVDARPGE